MVHTTALVLSGLSLIANIASAVPAGKSGCNKAVRMISVRGSDEILGNSVIKTVFSSLLESGKDAYLQGTPYPATLGDYLGSEGEGVGNLKSIIQQAAAECPEQKLVLVGYSQGAHVIADALCGNAGSGQGAIGSQYHNNIAAAVLFGDPSHEQGQSFVTGGGYNSGMVGRQVNKECAPFTDKVLSVCHFNDPVCDSGNDMIQHLTYMPELNSDAVQFINSKI